MVVLDNQGRLDATVWRDLLTEIASIRGLAGTVIDDVRDGRSLREARAELGYHTLQRRAADEKKL